MSIIKRKLGYIANLDSTTTNDRGVEVKVFQAPWSFVGHYMPLTDEELRLEKYGDDVDRVLRMFVKKSEWYGKIHTGDRAYLIDEGVDNPTLEMLVSSDSKYCVNANYQVSVCAIQNFMMKIEFQKISERK